MSDFFELPTWTIERFWFFAYCLIAVGGDDGDSSGGGNDKLYSPDQWEPVAVKKNKS